MQDNSLAYTLEVTLTFGDCDVCRGNSNLLFYLFDCLFISRASNVDGEENAIPIQQSVYDTNSQSILIPTNHLSVYGLGYTVPSSNLVDIANNWAKESITMVDSYQVDENGVWVNK